MSSNVFWDRETQTAWCPVCQANLGQEEIDFDTCDACGGEGFFGEAEEHDDGMGDRACRVCGCTHSRACVDERGPCWWVAADLCSHCQEPAGKAVPL